MTANECYRPPVDTQLRYTVQWFHEWSEMQRGDFLPVLAQKLAPGSYVNGLLSKVEALSCNEGRPPSLFQCRVKLFREWFETWGQAERDQLLGHIKSMDPGFYAKIQEALENLSSHGSSTTDAKTNGLEDTPDENQFSDEVQIEAKDEKPVGAEDVADLQLNSDDPRDEEEALDKEDEAPTI